MCDEKANMNLSKDIFYDFLFVDAGLIPCDKIAY